MLSTIVRFAVAWWWMPLLGIAAILLGLLLMRWLILHIEADYFVRPPRDLRSASPRQYFTHLARTALKNIAGLLLLAAGALMIFTPGPGLLAMVLGLSLMDFPFKQRWQERLLGRPFVLQAANRLRARHGVSPLLSPRAGLDQLGAAGCGLSRSGD